MYFPCTILSVCACVLCVPTLDQPLKRMAYTKVMHKDILLVILTFFHYHRWHVGIFIYIPVGIFIDDIA